MSRDLDQLLHDTAAVPDDRPDPAGLVLRGRRRRRRRHAAGAASAVAAVLAIGVVGMQTWPETAPQVVDQPEDAAPAPEQPTPTPDDTTTPEIEVPSLPQAQPVAWPDGPSQSPEDAAAQGVPAEVAALPLADRLELRGATQAPEGLYVTSGLPHDVARALVGDDRNTRLEDGGSPYEYEEILLLDPDTLTIERAWSTSGLTVYGPTVLANPPVLVAARWGDGGEPWTSVIVIDRQTGERRGFVGPLPDGADAATAVDSPWVTDDWVTSDWPFVFGDVLGAVDGLLLANAGEGRFTLHDPETLEVVDELRSDDVVTGLVPAGGGTFVESGVDGPVRFLRLDGSTFGVRDDLPAFTDGSVWQADVSTTPLLVSGSVLWRLDGQTWVEVFDGDSHPVDLHSTPSATYATGYDWRTGGKLFRNGDLVAERPIAGPSDASGTGGPVVAERSDGSILWIDNGVPHVVDLSGPESTEMASELPCDAMSTWTVLPAVFYVCDGPNSFAVGVPASDRDASLQDLLDQLGSVPDAAAAAGMTTVFSDITPPTITVDGTSATLDFDETLEGASAQTYTITYLLEQVLTTVWVNSDVETIQLTLDGDCDAASDALETVPCFVYDRADGNNTTQAAADRTSASPADGTTTVQRILPLSPGGMVDVPFGTSRREVERLLGPLVPADCPVTDGIAAGPWNVTLWFDDADELAWVRVSATYGDSSRPSPTSVGPVTTGDTAVAAVATLAEAGYVVMQTDTTVEAADEAGNVLSWNVIEGVVWGVHARTEGAPVDPTDQCTV